MTTHEILLGARAALPALSAAGTDTLDAALLYMAEALDRRRGDILAANEEDMREARESGKISSVMLDRLHLDDRRIDGMCDGIRDVAALPSPLGRVLSEITRPNGLKISKISVSIGVVAIIYESRPNVTSDAAALALKSGNACVLRCGHDAARSAAAIVSALREGLAAAGLPAVQGLYALASKTQKFPLSRPEPEYAIFMLTGRQTLRWHCLLLKTPRPRALPSATPQKRC